MKQIQLSNVRLERLSILFYGDYGSGKSRFLRDIIETELADGAPESGILYISHADDEGYMPLKGLTVPAVELDDPKDIDQLIGEYTKKPLHLLCVDGMDKFSDLAMRGTIGSDRAPKGGGQDKNEWTEVHRAFFQKVSRLRKCASLFMATSPAAKYNHPVTGDSGVYPDLPGSQASRVIGAFDFSIGIEFRRSPLGKTSRWLRVKPANGGAAVAFTLRQRLLHELTEDIEIPHGGGAWAVLKKQIEEAMGS